MHTLLVLLSGLAFAQPTAPTSRDAVDAWAGKPLIEAAGGITQPFVPSLRVGVDWPFFRAVTERVRRRNQKLRHGVFSLSLHGSLRTAVEPQNAVQFYLDAQLGTRWMWHEGTSLALLLGAAYLHDMPAGDVYKVNSDGDVSAAPLAARPMFSPSAQLEIAHDIGKLHKTPLRIGLRGGIMAALPWNTGVLWSPTAELVFSTRLGGNR